MHRSTVAGLTGVIALAALGVGGLAVQAVGQPANHPQVELVASAVSRLDGGARPAEVVGTGSVDMGRSNQPFLIVTDSKGGVLASSAKVGGETVLPPSGVFDYVRSNGQDRVTWQPAPGVREWIVVDTFDGGFVIAGRTPTDNEQTAYLVLLWGSFAAIGLALIGGVALVLGRR